MYKAAGKEEDGDQSQEQADLGPGRQVRSRVTTDYTSEMACAIVQPVLSGVRTTLCEIMFLIYTRKCFLLLKLRRLIQDAKSNIKRRK